MAIYTLPSFLKFPDDSGGTPPTPPLDGYQYDGFAWLTGQLYTPPNNGGGGGTTTTIISTSQTHTMRRAINIAKELTNVTLEETLYSSTNKSINDKNGAKSLAFIGYLTALRLTAVVTSLPLITLPSLDLLATDAEKAALAQQIANYPRYQLELYLREKETFENRALVATVSIYNSFPINQIDIFPFLTDLETFPIAPTHELYCAIRDVGYGTLGIIDSIYIYGSVLEETTFYEYQGTIQTID